MRWARPAVSGWVLSQSTLRPGCVTLAGAAAEALLAAGAADAGAPGLSSMPLPRGSRSMASSRSAIGAVGRWAACISCTA